MSKIERFLLSWPNSIIVEGRPGWSDITWGIEEVRNLMRYEGYQISRVRNSLQTYLRRIFTNPGQCRHHKDRKQGQGLVKKEGSLKSGLCHSLKVKDYSLLTLSLLCTSIAFFSKFSNFLVIKYYPENNGNSV